MIDPAERGLVEATWQAVAQGVRASSEQAYTLRLPGGQVQRVRERLAAVHGGDGRVEPGRGPAESGGRGEDPWLSRPFS